MAEAQDGGALMFTGLRGQARISAAGLRSKFQEVPGLQTQQPHSRWEGHPLQAAIGPSICRAATKVGMLSGILGSLSSRLQSRQCEIA